MNHDPSLLVYCSINYTTRTQLVKTVGEYVLDYSIMKQKYLAEMVAMVMLYFNALSISSDACWHHHRKHPSCRMNYLGIVFTRPVTFFYSHIAGMLGGKLPIIFSGLVLVCGIERTCEKLKSGESTKCKLYIVSILLLHNALYISIVVLL